MVDYLGHKLEKISEIWQGNIPVKKIRTKHTMKVIIEDKWQKQNKFPEREEKENAVA